MVMYGKYREKLIQELEKITESGLYKSERHITSSQQARINVAEKQVLNMCANNYLGLANNSEIIEAVKTGIQLFGMTRVDSSDCAIVEVVFQPFVPKAFYGHPLSLLLIWLHCNENSS